MTGTSKHRVFKHGVSVLILVFFALLALVSGSSDWAVRAEEEQLKLEEKERLAELEKLVGRERLERLTELVEGLVKQERLEVEQYEAGVENDPGDFDIVQNKEGTVTINRYRGRRKKVVIPGKISGIDVTHIGARAFSKNQLTGVIIPDGVISIGGSAFQYNQLTSITIPARVTSIGVRTFEDNQLTFVVDCQAVFQKKIFCRREYGKNRGCYGKRR
jgi:hypothetical protein